MFRYMFVAQCLAYKTLPGALQTTTGIAGQKGSTIVIVLTKTRSPMSDKVNMICMLLRQRCVT